MMLASTIKSNISKFLKSNPTAPTDKIAKAVGVQKSLVPGYIQIMERDGMLRRQSRIGDKGKMVNEYVVL